MDTSCLELEWRTVAEEIGVSPGMMEKVGKIMATLEAHHSPTAEHCKRVGILAVRIGRELDLPLKPLFYGGSLHDRGKLSVATKLLEKTGEWSEEDIQSLSHHPNDGYEASMQDGMLVTAGLIARHHQYQQMPYPEAAPEAPSFVSDIIGPCARIVALADFYDAAHRRNSVSSCTGEETKAKILAHNGDVADVVERMYQVGVFALSVI